MRAPRGFNAERREDYLYYLRQGVRRGQAAELVGMARIPVIDYIEANDAFRRLVEDAELEANELVEEALFQAAASGSVSAAKTWLARHKAVPERAKEKPEQPANPGNPFEGLDNVEALDPRRRARG